MKRFIIGISAIILLLFIGFVAVFYGGFYVDLGRDNHVNTFVRTENKEILIKDKDKWKPFEVRGIDMGSGIPGEWSTDYHQRNLSSLVSADPGSRSKYAESLFCPESVFL